MDYHNREVNIVVMLKFLLRYWKCVLLITVLCGFIGTGIGYFKYKSQLQSSVSLEKDSFLLKEKMSELYKSLNKDEQDRVDFLIKMNNKLTEVENYINSDILMNIDPYNIPTKYSYFDVVLDKNAYKSELEKISYTNQLRNAYDNYINNGKIASELAIIYADQDFEEKSLGELFESEYDSVALGDSSFLVSMIDLEELPDLDKNVSQLLEKYSKELNQKLAQHELNLVDTSRKMLKDYDLAELQEKMRVRYENTKNTIRLTKSNGELSDSAISYYEYKIGEDGFHLESLSNNSGSIPKKKTILKYALIMMIAGFMLAFVVLELYYLVFIYSRYIVSTNDYASFNLSYLGDIADDNCLAIIVSKIYKYCSNTNVNTIGIISTDMSIVSKETMTKLKEGLKKKEIEGIDINGNNLNDISVEKLFLLKDCFFIEKVNFTKIEKLNDLIHLCDDSQIRIAGVVNVG